MQRKTLHGNIDAFSNSLDNSNVFIQNFVFWLFLWILSVFEVVENGTHNKRGEMSPIQTKARRQVPQSGCTKEETQQGNYENKRSSCK